ncbi:hypothetical protein [Halarcobacter bivalviorum]|uniref:hypothetical protein n=1 Tax=Halarcobacter bivalviorum TaxID=663364 RepID=UPI00100BEBF1|nr:hypothetical protein [Halarcobacter bivalviorum]RXK06484.1 hypothetical protein CRU97_04465 [Halarcobacter bivalviorum]
MNSKKEQELNQIRYSLVGNWLYKIKEGYINNEILIFFGFNSDSNEELNNFKKSLPLKHKGNTFLVSAEFDKFKKVEPLSSNIVLTTKRTIDFSVFDRTDKEFLFINYEAFERNGGFEYIQSNWEEFSQTPFIQKYDEPWFFIKKYNPIDIIFKRTDAIENFLYLIFDDQKTFNIEDKNSVFYRGYYFNIKDDLAFLISENILTSRLAIIIYKLANLNSNANETEIGRFYKKELGTRALNKSNKNFGISNIKCYVLNSSSTIEEKTRLEIATNLLKSTKLSSQLISEVTGLNKNIIDKLPY